MAILVDYSNVASACMMVAQSKGENVNQKAFEILLGRLRFYNHEFREQFGELTLCTDSFSWRNKIFEHYKGRRKLERAARLDNNPDDPQHQIYSNIHEFWELIKEFSPYKCLKINGAEGDDILAAVAMTPGKHLVISADKDISQLTRFDNVKCFHPIKKTMIDNGRNFWHTLVVRGDAGDGVPNILSDDDTFMVESKRQRQLRQPVVDRIVDSVDPEAEILEMKFSGIFSEEVLRNYRRNKRLIDLTQIPKGLRERVVEEFNKEIPKRDLMTMITKLRCPQYVTKLSDFVPRRETIEAHLDMF
ncbi:putative RNase H [Sinorhizobium phage phiM9]|uniref:Putative RNase H n=1 Tax=Sinorhizobium phage phiM9 TaxID=1636182 RepID=A0A0F6R7J5_9CAUD|nr:putative RNase H [Sinorhizobium phage phiM9]AKE44743.1 putative RNase H [Sinorhizobium phage phiM9]